MENDFDFHPKTALIIIQTIMMCIFFFLSIESVFYGLETIAGKIDPIIQHWTQGVRKVQGTNNMTIQ